jgi:iron(III) transport system substrate-binding protein
VQRKMAALVVVAVLLAACQPSTAPGAGPNTGARAAPAQPEAASAPAASPAGAQHPPEVQRLLAAARAAGETELNVSWAASSLGGAEGARRFEAEFNRMYGTSIRLTHTPGPSMQDMAFKIPQELAAGQKASTDILLGTDSTMLPLVNRDVLETYDYTQLSPRITREVLAPGGMAVAVYSTVPAILYNSNLVSPPEVPRRLEDVLQQKWKGTIASTQYAAYLDRVAFRPEWGPERMKAYVARLSEYVGGLIRASEEVRIITGEFTMLVMGNTHAAREQAAKGAPLAAVIPEDGAIVSFVYLGVPRNSAHPNLGKLFVNMVLSEAGQRILYETYFTDHYALPGSQSAAPLLELKARGVSILEFNMEFLAARPEVRELPMELEVILRERRAS